MWNVSRKNDQSATLFFLSAGILASLTSCRLLLVSPNNPDLDNPETVLSAIPAQSPASSEVTVSSVSPPQGPFTGGTLISIAGSGFVLGATVQVGGSACQSVSVASSSALTCKTAANAIGTVDIVVTNSDGKLGVLAHAYTFKNTVTTVAGKAITSGGGSLARGGGIQMQYSIGQTARPSRLTAPGALLLPGVQGTFYRRY